jgi:hypothetical protein
MPDQLTIQDDLAICEKTGWASERLASTAVGMQARTLRRNCIDGKINISFRNTNGRNYQYRWKEILKYQNETSTAA